jgi:hypothetical protein
VPPVGPHPGKPTPKPSKGEPGRSRLWLLVGVLCCLVPRRWFRQGPELVWVVLSVLVVVGLVVAWRWWRAERLRDRVIAAKYLLCPRCMYDLASLATPARVAGRSVLRRCPECGVEYTVEWLEAEWEARFNE